MFHSIEGRGLQLLFSHFLLGRLEQLASRAQYLRVGTTFEMHGGREIA
jgi:hypothetical protein